MFCANCGKEIGNARFCPHCGAEVPSSSRVPKATGTLVIRKANLNTLVGIGTDVYVDNQFNTSLGSVNNATLTIPAGNHEVKLVFKDYEDAATVVNIIPNATSTYVLAVNENNKMTELSKWEDPNVKPVVIKQTVSPVNQPARKSGGLTCPKCGANNVSIQVIQENRGGTTITKTKGSIKEKGHGILWWLFIGLWIKIIDIFIWIVAFFPRLVLHIVRSVVFPKKKKYKTESTSIAHTTNKIVYKKICTCQNCGNSWSI